MSTADKRYLIPLEAIPEFGTEQIIDKKNGEPVILVNEVLFMGYKRAQGALSKSFFIPLRDEMVVMAAKCPKCGTIECPPFERLCAFCGFIEMEPLQLPDTGLIKATPPLVVFAPMNYKHMAPYARGDIQLGVANSYINIICRTTTGNIRHGIFKKDTPVKVVFKDQRDGLISDIFILPMSELSDELQKKSPLFESDIDWTAGLKVPEYEGSISARDQLKSFLDLTPAIQSTIQQSPKAIGEWAKWNDCIQCRTAGGDFVIQIADGLLSFTEGFAQNPNLTIAIQNPSVFLEWWEKGWALADYIADGSMWMNKVGHLETFFKLDRTPRFIRLDKQR